MKRAGFWFLIISIALLIYNPLRSSSIRFDHISQAEGLSQGTVYCIFQDQKGFLWFGTEDGLNKYDGYTFKYYRNDPRNSSSLSNNFVMTICEDIDTGDLWIGTWGGGLNRFIRKNEMFDPIKADLESTTGLASNDILVLYIGSDRTLWIGHQNKGLNSLDLETNEFQHYSSRSKDVEKARGLSGESVISICEDRNGNIWVGTSKSGLNRLDRETGKITHFIHYKNDPGSISHNSIPCLYVDNAGTVWAGTNDGLNRFNDKTGTFQRFPLLHAGAGQQAPKVRIKAIREDIHGDLWIGTWGHGLFKLNPETGESTQYKHDPRYKDSLVKDKIMCLVRDESGIFWIGTYGGGLNKFEPERPKFNYYGHDHYNSNKGLSHSDVLEIFEGPDGVLWLGTDGGGLNRYDPKTGLYTYYKHDPANRDSIADDRVYSITREKSGIMWIGTYRGGLNRFDPGTGKFERFMVPQGRPPKLSTGEAKHISNNHVMKLLLDHEGILWIGTLGGGLNRFNPGKRSFYHYRHNPDSTDSITSDKIYTIYEDRSHAIWVGTAGGGLNRLDLDRGKFTKFQPSVNASKSMSSNTILAILEDKDGTLWIGTTLGLNRMDKNKTKFSIFKMDDGLPNDVINAILEDEEGNLWLSTNRGLSKFDKDNTFRNYNVADGLQGYEFNMGSALVSKRDGTMYFGGINGFNSFKPKSIEEMFHEPKIVFTSFKNLNDEAELDSHINLVKEIELSYTNSSISFEFAALDFSDPSQNQYRYQLFGSGDDRWKELGNERTITFPKLDHGQYILKVKGSNNNGVWSKKAAELKIYISPPYWKTWWFAVIVVFVIAGVMALIIRSRFKKLEYKLKVEKEQESLKLKKDLEKKQLENELKLKADFTAMLVHDLRSPLTAIMGYADLLITSPGEVNIEKVGQTVSRSSDRMLSLINDMLDISKFEAGKMKVTKKRVFLVTLVRDIASIMQPLFDKKQLQVKYEFPEMPRVFIDPEKIGQVIDNLISNGIKFSPTKGVITLRVREVTSDDGKLFQEFSITDVGPGVPKEKRANLFDKYAQFQSSETKGTGLGLAVSRLIIDAHGGKIGYTPKDGVSHTFYFQVPVLPTEKSKVIEISTG